MANQEEEFIDINFTQAEIVEDLWVGLTELGYAPTGNELFDIADVLFEILCKILAPHLEEVNITTEEVLYFTEEDDDEGEDE